MKSGLVYIFGWLSMALMLSSCGSESSEGKIGFMDNVRVFEEFEMKKDYDQRMEVELRSEVNQLDSLERKINTMISLQDTIELFRVRKEYYVLEQQYQQKFESLATRYTNEVNDRLNGYIKKYSEKNGYDFILGSGGQGNVMYVKENKEVTEKLIEFINKEFNKK